MEPMDIDWNSEKSHLFYNQNLPEKQKALLENWDPDMRSAHIWLPTSGTSGEMKLIGLSKQAFLKSAQSVNRHLQTNSADIWLNPLPLFHVGGLSVLARSYVGGFRWERSRCLKWEAKEFCQELTNLKATLTSLVPTQVYDLVTKDLKPPSSMRAVLVGGAALEESLYRRARKLGWPLLPSYGMTEMSSTIAIAELGSLHQYQFPQLRILPHVSVERNNEEILIAGESRYTAIVKLHAEYWEWFEPDKNAFHATGDRGEVLGSWMTVSGRMGEVVKIAGELVSLAAIHRSLFEVLDEPDRRKVTCLFTPNRRYGFQVDLILEVSLFHKRKALLNKLSHHVLPLARPKNLYVVNEIPRTVLGKIATAELRAQLHL